jgi:hypothetical protein
MGAQRYTLCRRADSPSLPVARRQAAAAGAAIRAGVRRPTVAQIAACSATFDWACIARPPAGAGLDDPMPAAAGFRFRS